MTTQYRDNQKTKQTKQTKQICGNPSCDLIDTREDTTIEIFKMCARCKHVQYCSKECQKSHWKVHRQHCTLDTQSVSKTDLRIGQQAKTQICGNTAFHQQLAAILTKINTPYTSRSSENAGIWYSTNYVSSSISYPGVSKLSYTMLNGTTNKLYWDIIPPLSYFKSKKGIPSSIALYELLNGPTFADCGNVIQISIYKFILDCVGDETFNYLFPRLYITQDLYTDYSIDSFTYYQANRVCFRAARGNPLLFLFDTITHPMHILDGDIVHIGGVDNYSVKHSCGFSLGWNLLYGNNKYIGFGPNNFVSPLSYDEIEKLLIDAYNLCPSEESLRNETCDHTLIDDQKSSINGLECGIRLNMDKLQNFIKYKYNSWHTIPDEIIDQIPHIENYVDIHHITPFSAETIDKTFDNYTRVNEFTDNLFNITLKFAKVVTHTGINQEINKPICLILSGVPGIGKTHLSVSVAKYASTHNKTVLFVDASTIEELFQLSRGTLRDFSHYFTNVDLIVIDDINSQYSISYSFLKAAVMYCIQNNKGLMISSNNIIELDVIESLFRFNIYDLQDLQYDNMRIPWTNTILSKTIDDLITYSCFPQQKAAGIIIQMPYDQSNQQKTKDLIMSKTDNIRSIYLVDKPYTCEGPILDLKCHSANEYDLSIINIYSESECEQLLYLIDKAHSAGNKIIILTESIEFLPEKIIVNVDSILFNEEKARLIARFNFIFPGINLR